MREQGEAWPTLVLDKSRVDVAFVNAGCLFGTDAYSDENTPLSDYEEKEWLLTDNARHALAIALTSKKRDGEITGERAVEIAHAVMRDNAVTLYRLY